MGLKMRILSLWTPEWFQRRGLEELAHQTTHGLEKLIDDQSDIDSKLVIPIPKVNMVLKGSLDERRKIMATTHNKLVETLIKNMGRDEAIEKGRETMFMEGLSLGGKFKGILGVEDSLEDLFTAARILYNVLGIEFSIKAVENSKEDKITMVVSHCTLAEYYTPDTCHVLSAADEGVVQGLNPRIQIKFTERITEGCSQCLAPIKMDDV
jgi:hypothetical protein